MPTTLLPCFLSLIAVSTTLTASSSDILRSTLTKSAALLGGYASTSSSTAPRYSSLVIFSFARGVVLSSRYSHCGGSSGCKYPGSKNCRRTALAAKRVAWGVEVRAYIAGNSAKKLSRLSSCTPASRVSRPRLIKSSWYNDEAGVASASSRSVSSGIHPFRWAWSSALGNLRSESGKILAQRRKEED